MLPPSVLEHQAAVQNNNTVSPIGSTVELLVHQQSNGSTTKTTKQADRFAEVLVSVSKHSR